MYQQPTMAHPSRHVENDRPPRPRFQLAGRQVTQEMFYTVERAKRDGRRVFFFDLTLHDDETITPPSACENCLGAEYLGLDVAMVGPLKETPKQTSDLRAAWHAKSWWLVARNLYPCPVCNPVREVQL
jgi:hypothetical protein